MGYNIAVVGATGVVGREILSILAEREFPVSTMTALATDKAVGREVSFGEDEVLKVQDVARFDFKGVDLVFFATAPAIATTYVPRAAAAGARVIDLGAEFRLNPDVPLAVPEVNAAVISQPRIGILASPSPAAVMLAVALRPLHEVFRINRIVVTTLQPVSDAGKEGMDELFAQTRAVYVNDPVEASSFPKQIAFNVIPQTEQFLDDGSTREEWGLTAEIKKLLGTRIKVMASCLRVPVFIGQSATVTIECDEPVDPDQARNLLRRASGVTVIDQNGPEGYITPAEVAGDDQVFISRIREDFSVENGLALWCTTDNLRKGSALNAVQIAERLLGNRS